MTTVYNSIGSFSMRTNCKKIVVRQLLRLAAAATISSAGGYSHADDQSLPSIDVPVGPDAEAAHQVAAEQVQRDWRLDPAIFTDISPVNAPEIAIKLPEDQLEEQ